MPPCLSHPLLNRGRIRWALAAVLTLALGVGFTQSWSIGLADNGDFTRLMQWIVSRPERSAINSAPAGGPAYDLRFYQHWIPLWHVQPWLDQLSSTSALLWSPGIALSLLIHPGVVSLALVGACEKLVAAALYFMVILTISDNLGLMVFFGVCFGLMLSTIDYAAYYSSFYAEAASGVFFLLFLFATIMLAKRPSRSRVLLYILAATLLSACKLQNVYLLPLSLALLIGMLHRAKRLTLPMSAFVVAASLTIGAPPIYVMWRHSSDLDLFRYNDFNRVYHGLLEFADDPRALLPVTGAHDASCIGAIVFTETGARCAKAYPASYSRAAAVRLMATQPVIVWRMIEFAADSMQDISLEYLGKYRLGDAREVTLPRKGPSSWISAEHRDFYTQFAGPTWNLWSRLKYYAFPRGNALLLYLALAPAVFLQTIGLRNFTALSYAGLFCIATCASQLIVVVVGDGKEEIIKHLYLANLAFDVSLILLLAAGLAILQASIKQSSRHE